MQSKISLKLSLFIAGTALLSAGVFLLSFDLSSRTKVISVGFINNSVSLEQVRSGFPTRLIIPKVNVDAPIEHVGLTQKGAMDVPKDPANAAWFDLGPHPGESGSAVIAGHFGWKNGIRAVFDDLNKLKKGDKVYVEDEKGVTVVFVVRELKTYGDKEEVPEVFTSGDGNAHLNLITCGGVWDKRGKSYSNRLVVFTDKE